MKPGDVFISRKIRDIFGSVIILKHEIVDPRLNQETWCVMTILENRVYECNRTSASIMSLCDCVNI